MTPDLLSGSLARILPARIKAPSFIRILGTYLLALILLVGSAAPAWAAKKKIVFFYIGAATGGNQVNNGHTAACAAAKKQITDEIASRKLDPNEYEIVIKNINDFSSFTPEELVKQEEDYIHLIKTDPEKYTQYYNASKETRGKLDPLLFETNFNLEKLSNFLEGEGGTPFEVAVGAHWLIPLAISQAKAAGRAPQVKTGWMFTDYYENPLFPEISKCIDMTFLGAKHLVDLYEKKGVLGTTVVSSGIPIHPLAQETLSPAQRRAFLTENKLNPDPSVMTITLAGGGEGLGNFPAIVQSIHDQFKGSGKKIQLVAICAKNKQHFENLTRMKSELEKSGEFSLKVTELVPNQDLLNYVKASDLYVVKSGGLSPTEGAVIGTPMILLDVLGGHERDNAKFYEEIGIGIVNKDPHLVGKQAAHLLNSKTELEKMKASFKEFREGRDFAKVAEFALDPSPAVKKPKLCWDERRTKEGLDLLKEVGLGNRDEMKFIRAGWALLDCAGNAASPREARAALIRAKRQFRKALVVNPDNYAANYMMAHVSHKEGNNTLAMTSIDNSLHFDLAKGVEGQFFHRGLYQLDQNEIQGGIGDLFKALSINAKQLPEKRDPRFRAKIRGILIKKLRSILGGYDPDKLKQIFAALMKLEQEEEAGQRELGNYAPPGTPPVIADADSTGELGQDGASDSDCNRPNEEELGKPIHSLHDAISAAFGNSDEHPDLDDTSFISVSPPFDRVRTRLYKVVNFWVNTLEKEKHPYLTNASHYRNELGMRQFNEARVYKAYDGLIRQIFPQQGGKADPFVKAVENYRRTIPPGGGTGVESKEKIQSYSRMAIEFTKKLPENSILNAQISLYAEKAQAYSDAAESGKPDLIHRAYNELLETYNAFLDRLQPAFLRGIERLKGFIHWLGYQLEPAPLKAESQSTS